MGKIGDLFVRLGLKKEGFSKGMEEAKQETQKFGKTLTDLKAGALAVWAAIGAGVIKLGKDIISATNLAGDSWEKTMSSMKASYHSMIAELTEKSANKKGFWMQFFNRSGDAAYQVGANAKAAGEAAKRMTEAFDAEFELAHSVRLQRGAIQQELNELYIAMRDTTLSPADRKAAAERYRALLEPIAEAEVRTYGNMMNIAIEAWQAGTDLDRIYSTEEVVEFFTKIGTQTDTMREKYADLFRVYDNRKGDKQNTIIFDIIAQYQQAVSQMSDVDKLLSRVTRSIKDPLFKTADDVKQWAESIGKEPIDLDLNFDLDTNIDSELEDLDAELERGVRELAENLGTELHNELMAQKQQIADAVAGAFTSSFAGVTESLMDMAMGIEGVDMSSAIKALLQPLGEAAKSMGALYMEMGIAQLAMKSGLKQPEALIAAGAALIAVGTAVTSGLKALYENPAGGTTASTAQSSTASAQQLEQEITINVVGEISGDKIILAGQKTLNKWSR